jgi:sterol 24-C-methyltransferase
LFKKAAVGSGLGSEKVVASDHKNMEEEADFFVNHYADNDDQADQRKQSAAKMVEVFYDLVTDFYESGWGQSFHFSPRGRFETFREGIARHEHYIASKIQLSEKEKCLDVGCGIGGPMRNIVQFSHADVTGVTINEYQVRRGNTLNKNAGLDHLCRLMQANFLDLSCFEEASFDKAFSIEATCHAGNRIDVFREVFRVLKPGGLFATYEWVLNDLYDPENPKHVKGRQFIEGGNALPQLIHDKDSVAALKQAGFELVESFDLAELSKKNGQLPWYGSLEAKCSVENFHHSQVATLATHCICWSMEKVGLAPKGTLKTHQFLLKARDGLLIGGQEGFFTPMYFMMGRKPVQKHEE